MKYQLLVASALALLVGCFPEFEGTAEYTFKTSEVRKALEGQPAHFRLHENMSHPMSNAYARVSFGGGRFTNELDVVKKLVASQEILVPFATKDGDVFGKAKKKTGVVHFSVDEAPGQMPVLRMEADIPVWLAQTNVLARVRSEQPEKEEEPLVFTIDPQSGALKEVEWLTHPKDNTLQYTCKMIAMHQCLLLNELFGDDKKSALPMLGVYAALPTFPDYLSDTFYTIVGDSDEPLGVEAKGVIVDGKHHDTFKATVKRGETLRLKIDKKHSNGEIRFHIIRKT